MMKILIAYDGSEGAEAALDDLPKAGLPGKAEALVVVPDVWLTSSAAEFTRARARRRRLSADSSSFAPHCERSKKSAPCRVKPCEESEPTSRPVT